MLTRISIWVVLVITCLVVPSIAVEVEVAGGAWQQDLSGTLSYQALSSNDLIDLEENLNFDEETAIFGRIKIETPAFVPNFYLVGAPGEIDGTGSKSVAVKFGDTTFNADTALKAKIRVVQYDIGLYYGLPFVKNSTGGMLNIDLGLNVRIADLEAEITGISGATTVTENENLLLPVPMLYIALKFTPIDSIAFEAEGRGISIGDNSFYSLVGRLSYQFAGPMFIAAGYRMDKLDIDDDGDELIADIELSGPFAELGLRF